MVGTISTNNLMSVFLGTLLLVAFAACGGSDESAEAFQRIHQGNGALTIADFGLLPFYIYESITYLPVPISVQSLLVIAWVGTAIAVVAVGFSNMAVLALGPGKASIGYYLRALFTATLAIVVLGETVELFHLIAVALVIVGVVLMSRGHTPAQRTA